LREVSNKVPNAELKLFLEVELGLVNFLVASWSIECFHMLGGITHLVELYFFRICTPLPHLTSQRKIYYCSLSFMIPRRESCGNLLPL